MGESRAFLDQHQRCFTTEERKVGKGGRIAASVC